MESPAAIVSVPCCGDTEAGQGISGKVGVAAKALAAWSERPSATAAMLALRLQIVPEAIDTALSVIS
jgi:hypothetical protein